MKNERLEKIASYINKNDKLADVGCDHGYLAIYAIKKGVNYIQLIDNKEGPLNSAKTNLAYYEDKVFIKYSLSSGLSDVDQNINTVAICGMGGELISKIILDDLDNAKRLKKLILQANSKVDILRKTLSDNSFEISDEDIIIDNDKTYEIIVCSYQQNSNLLTLEQIKFGPVLMKKLDKPFVERWLGKLNYNNQIIKKLKNDDFKKSELECENKMIKEVIKYED